MPAARRVEKVTFKYWIESINLKSLTQDNLSQSDMNVLTIALNSGI